MPKQHVKPTKEELKEDLKTITEEAEELKDKPVVEEETPTPEEEPKVIVPKEPEEEEPVEPEPTPEPEEEEEEQPKPKKEEPDLKKKLSASARENQKIYAKNRVLNKALIDADETPEPTEEELISEFKDYDVMSDTERTFAKETVISRNWRATIKTAQDQAKKIEKWNESVASFVEDPATLVETPELEGKTEEFKEFATQESNNSVPFKILVGAFLHEQSKVVKHKGKMFESGSGGPNDKGKPKSDKLTIEEGAKLRETNYNKYREYLKAGKIESEI